MCPVRDQVQTWKHSISERVSNPEQDSNKILARQPGLGQPISCTPVIRGKEFFKGHGAQDPRVLYLCLWRLNACRIHPYRHDLIGQQQWNTQLQFPCPGNQVIGITREGKSQLVWRMGHLYLKPRCKSKQGKQFGWSVEREPIAKT